MLTTKLNSLESLDISANSLTDSSLVKLIPLLQQAKSIQELYLQGNRFTANGVHSIIHALHGPVRAIDVSHASLGNPSFRSLTSLTRLDVAYTGLSEVAFATLIAELPTSLLSLHAKGTVHSPIKLKYT